MTETQLHGRLMDSSETTTAPTVAAIRSALAAGRRFWLDLDEVDEAVIGMLRHDLSLHPLAVEQMTQFGQQPKTDSYDDLLVCVVYGLTEEGDPVEVHCLYGENYLVTTRRAPSPGSAPHGMKSDASGELNLIWLWHRVLDQLVDSFFPVLDAIDDWIDALEADILRQPTESQLGRLFGSKRRLLRIRRLAWEQRDMFGTLLTESESGSIHGMTPDAERYFRDLYDHAIRISQTADSYRDIVSAAVDTHLSVTSNRLNLVMKQLAIIATIFLPLSFVTGFFGQNFKWLTDRIVDAPAFWVGGVALQVVIAASLLLMFWRKGWIGRS